MLTNGIDEGMATMPQRYQPKIFDWRLIWKKTMIKRDKTANIRNNQLRRNNLVSYLDIVLILWIFIADFSIRLLEQFVFLNGFHLHVHFIFQQVVHVFNVGLFQFRLNGFMRVFLVVLRHDLNLESPVCRNCRDNRVFFIDLLVLLISYENLQ